MNKIYFLPFASFWQLFIKGNLMTDQINCILNKGLRVNVLRVMFSFFCATMAGHADSQQSFTVELPAGRLVTPATVAITPQMRRDQAQKYLGKTNRIRSHHRPVPLRASIRPFSTEILKSKALINSKTTLPIL